MSRDLNSTLATALSNSQVSPCILVALQFKSGIVYVWSGVGSLVFNGNTYIGVGSLGQVSEVKESSGVVADGMKVTLSGIGLSPFALGGNPPVGVIPPRAASLGENIAWMYPNNASTDIGNSAYADAIAPGNAPGAANTGITQGSPFGNTAATATLSSFQLAGGSLPPGAVVTQVTTIMKVEAIYADTAVFNSVSSDYYSGPLTAGATVYNDLLLADFDTIPTWLTLAINTEASLLANPLTGALSISNACVAVYYTAPGASTLINEAMNDYQMGGTAKVYFGLMQNGALVGVPYLIFSGQVDQPTINVSTQSSSISIDLENKLVNLSRPTARRLTSGDQHILYPDDIGLNWVELLQDAAWRWGTSNSLF